MKTRLEALKSLIALGITGKTEYFEGYKEVSTLDYILRQSNLQIRY